MKKPPRKSKDGQYQRTETSCQTDFPVETNTNPDNNTEHSKPANALPLNMADNIPPTLPSLTSKSFKMFRIQTTHSEKLGIIISKKRNSNKDTTGYIIAHVVHSYIQYNFIFNENHKLKATVLGPSISLDIIQIIMI